MAESRLDLVGRSLTPNLVLNVDGEQFEHWISAEVEQSLDTIAWRFSMKYLDRRQSNLADQSDTGSIVIGNRCTVILGIAPLFQGHIDRLTQSLSGDDRTWTAEGRSVTGDLVDCSAVHKTSTWRNKTALEIIQALCEPFGIPVLCPDGDDERFARFAIIEGETVFNAIDRLCKVRGFIPVNSSLNWLFLRRFDDTVSIPLPMELIISRTIEQDFSDRYSDYVAHATDIDGKGSQQDSNVTRYRPLVIVPQVPSTAEQQKTRAQWEQAIRAGRSERYRCTVLGLVDMNGDPYEPGRLYRVEDTQLNVQETLLCARVVFRVSESESVTELELCRQESYSLRDFPEKLLSGTTKKGKKITKKVTKAPKR